MNDAAYADALVLVAVGEDRDIASDILVERFPSLSLAELHRVMDRALADALRQGIEREDIDSSWFASA